MMNSTTINILSARLRLVHLDRTDLNKLMSPILDCWYYRPLDDPFFSLVSNAVEISLFADSDTVERSFSQWIQSSKGEGDESVIVGEDVWVALEISFHGGYEHAGERVKELAAPLAQAGVSILFLSTYNSDYILVQLSELSHVTAILEESGFTFSSTEEEDEESSIHESSNGSRGRMRASSSSTAGGSTGVSASRLSGSLVFSETSSDSKAGSLSRSGSGSKSIATGFRPSLSTPITPNTTDGTNAESSSSRISPATVPSPSSSNPTSRVTSPLSSRRPSFKLENEVNEGPLMRILPDELVCVGLSTTRKHEGIWKTKIVEALFFPERVLEIKDTAEGEVTGREEEVRRSRSSRREIQEPLSTSSISEHNNSLSSVTSSKSPSPSRSIISSTSCSSLSSHSSSSSPSRLPHSKVLPPPIPFIALTVTQDGTSLTSDIRLLRKLFDEEEEEMIYAVGTGGLRGVWAGEDEDGDEEEEEEGEERRERERVAKEGGRSLLKAIQLDLASFGLDKHGIVEKFSGALFKGGVNLLFQSSYQSASILVAKEDLVRARKILENH